MQGLEEVFFSSYKVFLKMLSNTLNLLAAIDTLVWQRSLAPAKQSHCDLDKECHLKSEWNLDKACVNEF